MVTRRQFLAATAVLPACSSRPEGGMGYDDAVRATWRHSDPVPREAGALLRELVRYATLAPSSHNTQCWKFRLAARSILIEPDLSRRCPAVDPDDHHLFVSLGCAAESIVQAARALGFAAEVRGEANAEGAVAVALEPARAVATPLHEAIPRRQCTRGEYDGRPLAVDDLKQLEQAGTGSGVRVQLLTDRAALDRILDFVVEGNTAQMADPAFVAELKAWIRFGADEAVRAGDGLYARSSGNPSLPRWFVAPLFGLFFTAKGENDKYARHVRSSAGIAVFSSDRDDRAHWVEVGRCYQRFALQATALGVRNAFLNQPVEVASLRPRFARHLGLGGRPDLVVRFGRGPAMPPSLRRPLAAVLA